MSSIIVRHERNFYLCPLCLFQVQPKHVKEAFRLLNKSIIRVETPDINLNQEDELEEEAEQQEDGKHTHTNPEC